MRRQDPEQVDEGVDMQSECETDSLTEGETEAGEEEESGEEGEEEEEEEEEGRESGREEDAMEQQQQQEREIVGSEERGHEEDMPQSEQGVDQAFSGRESQLSSLKQDGSGGEGSMADLPAVNISEQKDDRFTASDGEPEDEDSKAISGTAGEDTGSVSAGKEARQDSESAARVSREKQPWELVDDPFTPLSIEQVSGVGSSSARENKGFVYYCTFQ